MSQGTGPIVEYLARSRDVVEAALGDQLLIETIAAIVDRVAAALGAGHKVLLAGNGGSAGDAQHIAGEIVGRFGYDRAPAAAIALTTDSSVLKAIAAARACGLVVIGFTGKSGGDMAARCDLCLCAPAESTPLIQQLHITLGHIVCGLVEERLFPRAGTAP